MDVLRVRCCIAGGGPAGMMLGYLLARAGVDVAVLEKHADFLRDFRGDTVHPSTLEVMAELGLLDAFLAHPHQELPRIGGLIGDTYVTIADFSRLRTRCHFIALMPQWDFLNFLDEQGRRYPGFRVLMRAEVTDLVEEAGRITGVRASTPDGPLEVRADLVIGADGRHSVVRERAGLAVQDLGAPIDVLWIRLSKHPDDPASTLGRFVAGRLFVTLDRGDYWQCAYVIRKGGFEVLKERGLPALREDVVAVAPFLHDRVDELRSWDDVKLLTVRVDRLRRWYRPGLLCIGDAAHAMSPIGGVGINLAIQDAVAAANALARPLRAGTVTVNDLAAVEKRRTFPIRVTQAFQVFVQNRVFSRALGNARQLRAPWPVKLLNWFPALRALPARFVGIGVRPEHVRTPELAPAETIARTRG
ncbi:MAG TPA: FAD-dependent oxidoreductase [Dongiaceae bacterium]|nr:FAD-dependent oxidoreductase [Dongiaceae bacterium]